MRRLLALLALVVALGATTTAHAQDSNGYSGGWTDPAATTTNDNGWPVVYLDAPHTLSGQVTHANGIQRVTAVLVPDPDNPPADGCDPSMSPVTAEQNGTTVTFHVDGTFPCNLVYQVKATAYAAAGGTFRSTPPPYQMPLDVAVAFPPAPVGTVTATASADGDKRSVKLEWPANTEPDLLGYVIQRTAHDKTVDLGQVSAGDTTQFADEPPASGTTDRYDVTAIRRGPDSTIKQVAATPTSVSVDVPTRATASSGGSASGDGSERGLTTVVTGKPSTGKPDSQLLSSVRARGGSGAPSGPPTTFDSGFQGTLPFKTGNRSAAALPGEGDPAVVATFDEGGSDSFLGSKAAMTFIAGGLAILVGAGVLFYVSRRAARDAY